MQDSASAVEGSINGDLTCPVSQRILASELLVIDGRYDCQAVQIALKSRHYMWKVAMIICKLNLVTMIISLLYTFLEYRTELLCLTLAVKMNLNEFIQREKRAKDGIFYLLAASILFTSVLLSAHGEESLLQFPKTVKIRNHKAQWLQKPKD